MASVPQRAVSTPQEAAKKSKRPAFRPGGGSYDHGDQRLTRAGARAQFLDVLSNVEPRVLGDLAGEPLRAYQAWCPRNKIDESRRLAAGEVQWGVDHKGWTPVREAIDDWAAGWHLTDLWCKAWALATLSVWVQAGDSGAGWFPPDEGAHDEWETPDEAGYGFSPFRERDLTFTFTNTIFDPFYGTLEESDARLRQAFERELAAFYQNIKSLAREYGGEPTPEKRNPDHYRWLAMNVVQRRTIAEIASIRPNRCPDDPGSCDDTAIKRAVKDLAQQLELTNRPPRGRPRKR